MQPTVTLLALALAFLPLAAPQDKPAPKKEPGTVGHWPWGNAKDAERISNEFCGVWQLMRVDLGGQSYAGAQCHGFLIAVPGYCSIQMRVVDTNDPDRRLMLAGLSAGTFKWEYDRARLMLVLTTQINANDMDDPRRMVMYEPPGTIREYQVDLAGDDLILDRGRDNRLQFHRLQKPPAPLPASGPAPEPPPEGKR